MKIISKLILIPLICYNLIRALDITENRINIGSVTIPHEPVAICSNSYWSIVDVASVTFYNTLTLQPNAMLYVSSTLPTISLKLQAIYHYPHQNDGIIAFNSLSSTGTPSFKIGGSTFVNNGVIYCASKGNVADTMTLNSGQITNNGLMIFYHQQRSTSHVSLHGGPHDILTNNGQICFRKHIYKQECNLEGTGCFTAMEGGSIHISGSDKISDYRLSYYLADSASSMVVSDNKDGTTFTVYGFGNGNKVALTCLLNGNRYPKYSYDRETGVLTLTSNLNHRYNFDIGTGYDPNFFEIVTINDAGISHTTCEGVTYTGEVPERNLPASCNIPCKDQPPFPMDNTFPMTTIYTTTWTRTYKESTTLTESGLVSRL
ncbi:hypothetical protein G210_5205, partial [Candida maltosa Xu316]